MSTVLKNTNPTKTILGFATLLDEKGEEMHKSKGNSIEFNEAADKIGVDVMRWMYVTQNPVNNLLFGYHVADKVRRRFYLILWNVYSFFVTYANIEGFDSGPLQGKQARMTGENILDKWIVSRFNSTVQTVSSSLEKYDMAKASAAIEDFTIGDLSTWYIRRSRDRVVEALPTLYGILVDLSKLISPFTPFISEEMYMNLAGEQSVNLADFPQANIKLINKQLEEEMLTARQIVEKTHALRKEKGIKVRQPLSLLTYPGKKFSKEVEDVIAAEVNVKKTTTGKSLKLDTKITPALKAEGEARDIIRQIQQARKEAGCKLDEKIAVELPEWPKEFEEVIKKETLSAKLVKSPNLNILRSEQ